MSGQNEAFGQQIQAFGIERYTPSYWLLGQIDLLHQVQFATNMNQITAARSAIQKLWPEQTPLALDQGAYYL
ncbi:hypothetical protein ACN38_g6416 [Penicillium nordicum]|uniref:Uncharacterized protein n=1 Tax=Penicillium nordicum TaxID=229535 RepID=A0A0M8NZW9_9EURO|nr:hypothetical protein ACN38_g6416 [Penicillium nordicum]